MYNDQPANVGAPLRSAGNEADARRPNPERPLFHWYHDSPAGKELVLALYTPPCRWGRCTFCALPTLSRGGEGVTTSDIRKQVDYVLSQYSTEALATVAKVSLYLAGSSLDPENLDGPSLSYVASRTSGLPGVRIFSFETRCEHIEAPRLQMLRDVLSAGTTMEASVGYETHDPNLRNRILRKGLTRAALRRALRLLSASRSRLKAYLMLKPHFRLSERDAVDEAVRGLDEIATLGARYQVPVSIHLNPTYVARGSRVSHEMLRQSYQPPEFRSMVEVLQAARVRDLPIQVGLDDEGLAVDGGTFRTSGFDRSQIVWALRAFNKHQNIPELLRATTYQHQGR